MKKILIKANMNNLNGLSYHRLIIPYSKLSDLQEIKVDVYQDIEGIPQSLLKEYHAVVYQREIDTTGKSVEKIKYFHNLGLKVIFDIDDYWHLHDQHPLNKVYKHYNIAIQTEEIFRHVDIVTCTTEILKEKILKFTDKVEVYPNCLNLEDPQWQPNKKESEFIRFGYVAGVHHMKDIDILRNPILKIKSKGLNAQLILGGFDNNPHYRYYEEVMNKGNYQRIDALPVHEYGNIYNYTDVSLIPLDNNRFNECKSEIKLLEAAAHGNAAIVSNVKPYNTFPKDTCLFIDNSDVNGWVKAIKQLTESKQMRLDYASKLKEYVNTNYNLNTWTQQRKNKLLELV